MEANQTAFRQFLWSIGCLAIFLLVIWYAYVALGTATRRMPITVGAMGSVLALAAAFVGLRAMMVARRDAEAGGVRNLDHSRHDEDGAGWYGLVINAAWMAGFAVVTILFGIFSATLLCSFVVLRWKANLSTAKSAIIVLAMTAVFASLQIFFDLPMPEGVLVNVGFL